MKKYTGIFIVALIASICWPCGPSGAQGAPATQPPPIPAAVKTDSADGRFTGSLFMSTIETVAIQQILSGKAFGADTLKIEENAPVPSIPTISLSGVVYHGPDDWIVWMNGEKVTPKNRLPEIIDIQVENSSRVNLKWYDVSRRKVISVTLRPRQTYDIATDTIWPGEK